MLQTVYRNLVCKQWDLAYVTQLIQSVFCDCGSSEVPVCCRPGYSNLVCKQWDLAYVTQLVQSVFCDCGSSEVPVLVAGLQHRDLTATSQSGTCLCVIVT